MSVTKAVSTTRSSRVFTVSFPEDLALQVEYDVARDESRNISERFREAFRSYRAERIERKLTMARPEAECGAGYGVADIEGLVDEVRRAAFRRTTTP